MANTSPLSLSNNLISRALNDRNDFGAVYDLSGGWNKFGLLVDAINAPYGGAKRFDSDKYEKAFYYRNHIIQQIASSTIVSGNMVINFVDPTYDSFRINDQVISEPSNISGKVISTSPGTITIEPPNGVTYVSGTHFVANSYVKVGWDSSPNFYSTSKAPLYEFPETDYNYSSIKRDTNYASRRQRALKTEVYWKGEYWGNAQVDLMVQRALRNCEIAYLFGQRNRTNYSNSGETDENGGLEWAIQNRGGVYYPLTSAVTETQFDRFLTEMWDRKANRSGMLTLFMGKGMMKYIQRNFTNDYIINSGEMNTFGGEGVNGIDVRVYSVAGEMFNLAHLPILDDPQYFPDNSTVPGLVIQRKKANNVYCLDMEDIPTPDGAGKRPAIEKITAAGDSPYYFGRINGMDQANSPSDLGDFQIISDSIDATKFEMMIDDGVDMPGQYAGMMEYTI